MVLQPQSEHPHGLQDGDFDELFTPDKPVIFAFHGDPAMIHRLVYQRHNHDNFHVHGFEEGTTTTPFDMVVLNHLDRYQLALDAIRRIPRLAAEVDAATARYWATMERHRLISANMARICPKCGIGAERAGSNSIMIEAAYQQRRDRCCDWPAYGW